MIIMKADGNTRIISTTNLFPEYFGIESGDKEKIKMYLAKRVGLILDDDVDDEGDTDDLESEKCSEEKDEEDEQLPGLDDDEITENDMYPEDDPPL